MSRVMALQDFTKMHIAQAHRETGKAKGHKKQIEHGKPSKEWSLKLRAIA